MELTSVTAQQTGAGPQSAQPASAEPSALSSDFDTFLKMLTVQMQNQDPLNPIQSADYAVQLATFSGVEQQVTTNDLLRALTSQMGLVGMSELAGWVGMEVRSTAPRAFEGAPLSLDLKTAPGADSADLVVRDAAGTEVQRMPIDPLGGPTAWAGVGPDGRPLPPDLYSFEVESRRGGELVGTAPVADYARVTEVRRDGDATVLVLDGGAEISADAVDAVREPIL